MLAAIHEQQQSPGLNPKETISSLERLMTAEAWEDQTDDDGRSLTFQRVLEEDWPTGLGLTESRRRRIFELAEDVGVPKKTIVRVQRLIDELLPQELRKRHGRPRKNDDASSFSRKNLGSNGNVYWLKRLERDAPTSDELERVRNGQLTAYAAAGQLGLRKPKPKLPHCPTCHCDS